MLTLWLKKIKECLAEIWKSTTVPLFHENSSMQQKLIQIIWTNAESPVSQTDYSLNYFVHFDCEKTESSHLCFVKAVVPVAPARRDWDYHCILSSRHLPCSGVYEEVTLQHLESWCVRCTLKMFSYASCCFPAGGRCVRTCSLRLQSAAGTVRDGLWAVWRHQEASLFHFTSAHHRAAVGNQSQISTPLWPAALSEHWHGEIKGWKLFLF